MISRIPLLTGLLAVQLLILALLWLIGNDEGEALEMLAFDPLLVSSLQIEDGEDNRISLEAVDGQWQLGELPADGEKVRAVIESLVGGSANWPVATSASSQSRFEVAEDLFQRRVQFGGVEGELATLYLGSSPGFRRIHARVAEADAIFSIDFGVHELPLARSDWLDKQLLQVERISTVTFPEGAVLSNDPEGSWSVDGQTADPDAAERYVDRIARLSVLGLYEAAEDTTLGEPVSITIEDDQGSHVLSFLFNEAVDEYVLESDRLPGAFTVASYIVEQILVPAADLLPEPEPEPEPELERSGVEAETAAES